MEKQKYRIELDKTKCISNKSCIEADPANFHLESGRIMLANAKNEQKLMFVEKDMDEKESAKAVNAAKVCPVNAIKIVNLSKNKNLVETSVKEDSAKVINAVYDDNKDFVLDPSGYFLIRILPQTKEIEVGFCGAKNKVEVIVKGKKPIDIYHTIAQLNLISKMEHASYLGRELQKAFIALQKGIKYVQDDELAI